MSFAPLKSHSRKLNCGLKNPKLPDRKQFRLQARPVPYRAVEDVIVLLLLDIRFFWLRAGGRLGVVAGR
jgi:hypothetical protein